MNRKLVNGLLLLSIATVGCGTFTSCKDTDEDVQAGYNKEIASVYKDLLDKINAIKQCNCDPNLKANLDAIAQWLGATNNNGIWTLPDGGLNKAIEDKIDEVFLTKLKDALGTNDPKQIMPAVAQLQAEMNKMMTSIEINQTYNPVFGTLNLPVGLQTNVLAGYYGESKDAFSFPDLTTDMYVHEVGLTEDSFEEYNHIWNAANLTPKNGMAKIPDGVYMDLDENGEGILGKAYLTINPLNIDFVPGLKLIKSTGAESPVTINTLASADELKFGYTRASSNGLYKATATIKPEDASKIAVSLKPEFKDAVVDILKNPSRSTLTKLGGALLDQMNGILPAYGFYAPWDAEGIYTDAEGNEVTLDKSYNAIVSKYELAATTIHPLGYNSLKDLSTSKRLPTFSPLKEAMDNVFQTIKDDAQFDFADNLEWNFDEDKMKITIDLSKVDGIQIEPGANPIITLGYQSGKVHQEGDNGTALNPLVNELIDKVNAQLLAIQGNINNQVQDIIKDVQDQLAGKVSTAQKLLDKYNALANKINAYLADPHGHMQVAMAYEGSDGALHMLSTSKAAPSRFSASAGGDAIKLLATSYTGDIAAPSYKKYVAVVAADKGGIDNVNAKSTYLNRVISGRQHIIDMTGFEKGATYTILYTSVDYRGKTSTRLYYLTVVD